MNIVVISREDHFFVPIYLKPLFLKYGQDVKVVLITGLPPYFTLKYFLKQFKYYGLINFLLKTIQLGLFKLISQINSFQRKRFFSVSQLCRYYKVSLFTIPDVHGKQFLSFLKKQKVDYLISVMSPVIFQRKLLKLAKRAVNVHPSLLPAYKGIDPLFWALKNGESEAGVTIHEMVEEVDSGKILAQRKFALPKGISVYGANLQAAKVGGNLLVDWLGGKPVEKISPKSKPSLYFTPKKSDIRSFIKQGGKLLNWAECFPF